MQALHYSAVVISCGGLDVEAESEDNRGNPALPSYIDCSCAATACGYKE